MIFAIGDLHLSSGLGKKKPMHIFDRKWQNHPARIAENWQQVVSPQDTVLLAGDISWAMSEPELYPDLEFIHRLNGRKIIVSGNHDYWWNSTARLNGLYEDLFFLKNSFAAAEGLHICGAKGWVCPSDALFPLHDHKLYQRELHRLQTSLDGAMVNGAREIIVVLHFPPVNNKLEDSGFTQLLQEYPVRQVVYGHLHGNAHKLALCGNRNGIGYQLVSADYVNFSPVRIV